LKSSEQWLQTFQPNQPNQLYQLQENKCNKEYIFIRSNTFLFINCIKAWVVCGVCHIKRISFCFPFEIL